MYKMKYLTKIFSSFWKEITKEECLTRQLIHIPYHNLIQIDIFIYDYYLSDMEIHPGTHEVFLISEVDKECQLSQINYNNNLKKKKAVVFCKRLQA